MCVCVCGIWNGMLSHGAAWWAYGTARYRIVWEAWGMGHHRERSNLLLLCFALERTGEVDPPLVDEEDRRHDLALRNYHL